MSKKIKGLNSLLNKLVELNVDVVETLGKSVKRNIKLVQGDAKDLCPVGDAGELRNSINAKTEQSGTGVKGVVYTNKEYAAYVEFGTGQRGHESDIEAKKEIDLLYREDWTGMEAQPYLYPALKNNEDRVIKLIKSDLQEAIRKVAK